MKIDIYCHCEPVRTLVWQSRRYPESSDSVAFYVYILSNINNRVIYTGVTNDLVRRVYEHKQHFDKYSFSAQYNVDRLVYFEETSSSRAAIEREKQIKSWNRCRKNRLIESQNPNWVDLYESIR